MAQNAIINTLKKLESKSRFIETITLGAQDWNGLQQTITTANALLESDTPHVSLINPSSARMDAWGNIIAAKVFIDTDGIVKINFICLEKVPEVDLQLQIEVIR